MPYPMSHFYIAEYLLGTEKIKIKDIPQFYLGTLAPDAVHFRKGYSRIQKMTSHLYISLNKRNTDEFVDNWKNNVKNFYFENNSKEIYEFLLGYCVHIMADIYAYKNIWIPFKLTFGEEQERMYERDMLQIDLELFQKGGYRTRVFPRLSESREFDFLELLKKNDLIGLKYNILNIQYNNQPIANTSTNTYISYDNMQAFHSGMIEYIVNEFIEIAKIDTY